VGLIWLAPDWVPRPFVLNAQSNKDGGKSGHTPSGTMRGVTDDEIVVGITAPMSGPASDLGREMEIGLQTCFRQVNADGGIGGRKLRLVALNDRSDPERARANMAELFEDNRVFAVIGNVGTATAEKTVPYALQKKMVCFGPYTGAPLVRKNPPDRYVFNCRASFLEESTALVKYLIQSKEISAEQIAVFAEDGPYGDAGFNAAAKALRGHGRRGEQILRVSHKRNTTDVQSAVKELLRHNEIRAVIMATTYRPAAEFIHQVRDAKRDDVVFASLSCVGSDSLADELRQLGPRYPDGVIVMQCVPQPDSDCSAVLRYREALQAYYPSEQPAFISLEGYLNATLLVEGLRRAGPNLTTENFVDALEAIRDLDIGLGSTFHFGPSEHQASHKVWATVLDHAGHFQPLELE
jgi:ABC-type branched-subunit amino acid transport system substrate-binding protein